MKYYLSVKKNNENFRYIDKTRKDYVEGSNPDKKKINVACSVSSQVPSFQFSDASISNLEYMQKPGKKRGSFPEGVEQ